MAKQQSAGKGATKPNPPAKPKEPKKPAKAPVPAAPLPEATQVTPKEEIPMGKAKCQYCQHLQPLKRGDGSISLLQGTCEVTRKIVWKTFFCDKFLIKP